MSYINIGKLTEEVNTLKAHEVIEFQALTTASEISCYAEWQVGGMAA